MMITILQATTEVLKENLLKFNDAIITIETKHTTNVLEKFDFILSELYLEIFDNVNEGYACKVLRDDLKAIEFVNDEFISLVLVDGFKINVVKS